MILMPLTISTWILITVYIFMVKNPIGELTIGEQIISTFLGLFVTMALCYFTSVIIAKLIILCKKGKRQQ